MDNKIEMYKEMVLKGEKLEKEQAMELLTVDLDELCKAADEIRKAFCDNKFDMCTIINGKSGRCSENCKYCAQAACHKTEVENYPLLSTEEILEDAKKIESQGVRRYSIVTSGKRLNAAEVDQMCECIKKLREETNLHVCGSFGLLDKEAFGKLKEAGLTRVHNNLETSRRYFPDVCTTHTFDDKIAAITAAKEAGLEVCSGGIMGIGEFYSLLELVFQFVFPVVVFLLFQSFFHRSLLRHLGHYCLPISHRSPSLQQQNLVSLSLLLFLLRHFLPLILLALVPDFLSLLPFHLLQAHRLKNR